MSFQVSITDTVKDQLSHLTPDIRRIIGQSIKTLQDFPFPWERSFAGFVAQKNLYIVYVLVIIELFIIWIL